METRHDRKHTLPSETELEEKEVNDSIWANSTLWWVVGLIAIFIIFFLIWI